ncbi:MAG: hypothetical protein C5B54_09080 [Acidobacteria bacterium]|nr:MAG: hypothetical protein C5B54_09080 [Acidobacteriota bacterium]
MQRVEEKQARSLEQQLEWVPEDARAHVLLAGRYASVGQTKNAVREVEEALALRPNDNNILYNAGCVYARLNMKMEAISTLKRALITGYGMIDWLERDPDLTSIRDEPEFQKLLQSRKS